MLVIVLLLMLDVDVRLAEHGSLGSFVFSDREGRKDDQVVGHKVSLGGNWYWFSVNLARDGKIVQIYWW
jgi:hypothetical protein